MSRVYFFHLSPRHISSFPRHCHHPHHFTPIFPQSAPCLQSLHLQSILHTVVTVIFLKCKPDHVSNFLSNSFQVFWIKLKLFCLGHFHSQLISAMIVCYSMELRTHFSHHSHTELLPVLIQFFLAGKPFSSPLSFKTQPTLTSLRKLLDLLTLLQEGALPLCFYSILGISLSKHRLHNISCQLTLPSCCLSLYLHSSTLCSSHTGWLTVTLIHWHFHTFPLLGLSFLSFPTWYKTIHFSKMTQNPRGRKTNKQTHICTTGIRFNL